MEGGGTELYVPSPEVEARNKRLLSLGMVAIETLKAVLDKLGIDRSTLHTGTDVVNAVEAKVTLYETEIANLKARLGESG